MPVVPRQLTSAERARPLPAAVHEVLATGSADAWDRIVELVADLDDDERERVLIIAMERLGLPRE